MSDDANEAQAGQRRPQAILLRDGEGNLYVVHEENLERVPEAAETLVRELIRTLEHREHILGPTTLHVVGTVENVGGQIPIRLH